MNYPDNIDEWVAAVVPVGSRVTCNPPPTNTDQDLLVLVETQDELYDFEEKLLQWDWESESESYKENAAQFNSWRKLVDGTEYNIILTAKVDWFDTFLDATFSCKEKNLLSKEERIAEFAKFFGPKEEKPKVESNVTGLLAQMQKQKAALDAMAQLQNQQGQQNLWANKAIPGALPGQWIPHDAVYDQAIYINPWTGLIKKAEVEW